VGGGGLLCGVVEGLRRNGLAHVPIVAVETRGADSLCQSIKRGERIELHAITSIATSLGAKQVCANAFEITKSHSVRSVVVSDREAVEACFRFLHDHRLLVEPACGASLAALAREDPVVSGLRAPLVIVCGGSTATLTQLQDWRTRL
jgi:L-serine/L-threonine ammonia-lyase